MPKQRGDRDEPRRVARWQALARQLVREAGDDRGAQRVVAERLGLAANTISKALAGERGPGADVIFAVWAKLRLPVDFFVCAGPDDLDYREFLRARTTPDLAQMADDLRAMRDALARPTPDDTSETSRVRTKATRRA